MINVPRIYHGIIFLIGFLWVLGAMFYLGFKDLFGKQE